MNDNERMRASVPITGIDTSTPDAIVADGKCERLHNLRYGGGAWRNVLESPDPYAVFSLKYPFKVVYQHPANKDNSYIAVCTEQNYHIYEDADSKELLYLQPREVSGIVNVYKKEGESYIPLPNDTIFYNAKTYVFSTGHNESTENMSLWTDVDDKETKYLTIGREPKVDDPFYRLEDDGALKKIGVITYATQEDYGWYAQVKRYNGDSVDFDIVFVKEIPAEGAKLSTIPPNAVVSFEQERDAISNLQILCQHDPEQKLSINHFGKTLFICRPNLLTFVLKDDKYNYTDFSRIKFQCSEKSVGTSIDDSFVAKGIGLPRATKPDTLTTPLQGDCIYYPLAPRTRDEFLLKQFDGDEWRGEICYFLTARMEDGTIIAVSPLFISGNNPSKSTPIVVQSYNGEKAFCIYRGLKFSTGVNWQNSNGTPTDSQITNISIIGSNNFDLNFAVYTDNDNPLIHDIALYSTRILPTFDLNKLQAIDTKTWNAIDTSQVGTLGGIFTDTAKDLANEPFYLVDSISWTDYKQNKKRTFHCTYPALDKAMGNSIFEPNSNIAPIIDFLSSKEYNSSMHFGGPTRRLPEGFIYKNEMLKNAGLPIPSVSNELFDGYRPDAPDDDRDYDSDYEPEQDNDYDDGGYDDGGYDDGGYDDYSTFAMRRSSSDKPLKDIVTRIVKSNKRYYAVGEGINPNDNQWTINNIISYPDASANSMMFCTGLTAGEEGVEYPLTPHHAINFAYHIIESEFFKFHNDHQPYLIEERTTIVKDIVPNTIFKEPNKLFVSATNNNFKLPFDQVYGIGLDENEILAINSAAIEMSDAKFGELPLYVFTKEGVYALQSGEGTTMYSAIIPINYDRIINPNTLAINNNLIYITEEGVKSLSSNQESLVSEVLNDADNKPLLAYLRNAELFNFKPYDELIVHNPDSDYAYVLALKEGYWSTRDFEGRAIGSDLVCKFNGINHYIYDLSKRESGEPISATIKTRPMKFGSHEFKRLETFIPRLRAAGEVDLKIRFYGSNDRVNWALLREVNATDVDVDIVIRRFPFSARYIYVEMEMSPVDVSAGFELSSMDIEYYLKYLRRLR